MGGERTGEEVILNVDVDVVVGVAVTVDVDVDVDGCARSTGW